MPASGRKPLPRRVLVGTLAIGLASCGGPATPLVRFEGEAMGTTYVVQIAGDLSENERAHISRLVEETLEGVDGKMSTYREDSELSRLNRAPAHTPIRVSPETFTVLEEALRVSRLTEGAFDVTVAPLVRLWGFGAGAGTGNAQPTEESVREAKRLTGYQHLRLDDDPPSVTKEIEGLTCDLSGIAKGYSVDRVAEVLEARGHRDFMVEVGGEVRTSGNNSTAEPWRIGIEKPLRNARALQRVVPLSGFAMATSGDYRNFREIDGRLVSHLIDPRTARPVAHGVASVSVVEPSCMRADALASGLLVLGPDAGYELAVKEGLSVLFLIREDDGTIRELSTPLFTKRFPES